VKRWPTRWWLVAGALLLGFGPGAARALEPRYDHRDQQGLMAEVGLARDSLVINGLTYPSNRLALRLAWSIDVSGEGDELQLGGSVRLSDRSDPAGTKFLQGVDARYRAYFGSEEFKTFIEIGLWSSLASRLAVGGVVGLGLAYDPSRAWGLYLSAQFIGAFGEARISTVGLNTGAQLRW
jgi:hypothetical protein